jgi:hypothetical protein
MPIHFSNCCGAEMNGHDLDYETCPDCHDHCEAEEELTPEEAQDLAENTKFDEYHDGGKE